MDLTPQSARTADLLRANMIINPFAHLLCQAQVWWLIHTARVRELGWYRNGTGTLGNNESWSLSLSRASVNISRWHFSFHLVPVPIQVLLTSIVNIPWGCPLTDREDRKLREVYSPGRSSWYFCFSFCWISWRRWATRHPCRLASPTAGWSTSPPCPHGVAGHHCSTWTRP